MKPKTAKRLTAAAIIAAVFTIAIVLRWPSAPKYEITDLGFGYAAAINNEGHVVGWHHQTDSGFGNTAFLWNPAKGRRTIPALEGKQSRAYDINDKGQVVGQFWVGSFMYNGKKLSAFIWDRETGLIELGSPDGIPSVPRPSTTKGKW
ncbi:MAG: DUF3466 family protein [Planctomycetota bacterium]|jgi:uncharacterized membrane protein